MPVITKYKKKTTPFNITFNNVTYLNVFSVFLSEYSKKKKILNIIQRHKDSIISIFHPFKQSYSLYKIEHYVFLFLLPKMKKKTLQIFKYKLKS